MKSIKTNLEKLISVFGWQGGTIHQVTNELNKRAGTTFSSHEILTMDETDLEAVVYLTSKETVGEKK
jgi:hypothetical protein